MLQRRNTCFTSRSVRREWITLGQRLLFTAFAPAVPESEIAPRPPAPEFPYDRDAQMSVVSMTIAASDVECWPETQQLWNSERWRLLM